MKLDNDPFVKIASGQKTVELRLFDERRRVMNIDDIIIFTNRDRDCGQLAVKISALYRYRSFEALFEEISPEKCGFESGLSAAEAAKEMKRYYSTGRTKKYGAFGIRIERMDLDEALRETGETGADTGGKHTVFVYGSLMRGEYNHDAYLKDANYLGKASIRGFGLYNLGYFPGIKHIEEQYIVRGELYEVSESAFDRICVLEGNGSLYQCEKVPAYLYNTGELVQAEVFVYLGKVYENERFSGDVQSWKSR